MKIRFLPLAVILGVSFSLAQPPQRLPHNLVLMIGDGMGVSQVTAGYTFKGRLALEQFPTAGLVLTQAYGDTYITDSGAGATALSTGVSSYNTAIAVAPDSTARETLLERAAAAGMRTGLVVVCDITDATPACFVAHVPRRSMHAEIAEQISKCGVDLLLGSGWEWFLPASKGGKREDGRDLIHAMERSGFTYVSTDSSFRRIDLPATKRLLGLFAEENDGWAQERKPSLRERTAAALEFLSQSGRGFFLMVEGSQIDWAGHHNDSDQIMKEMADFDDAIGEVTGFSRTHPGTLIVVTADHETGGYALNGGSLAQKRVEGKFTTGGHTGTMVPLFAMGPGAEQFGGIHRNAEIGRMLRALIGPAKSK